ncbi:hypothetical protein AX774_g1081 [Zancudomyces culisetae]|uniref:Uncharacterized protein n=1 Tax=Zancudomyces culisetae TaxID=1213189 RepID=A0A1R1PWU9_ZANCU|nr:hypothetical protein AX774_g1081 [Zancudomyces culisetae]|eukprot:OMH85373.1 hypothetical protein AX774_g1081 [Zancudomyces culisetae]
MVKTIQLENGVKVLIEYVVGDDKDSTLTGEKAEDVSNVLLTPGLGTAGGNDKELTEYFTNIVNQLLNLAEESDDNSGRIAVSVLEALAVRFPNYFKAFVYEKTTNELVKWGLNKVPNKQGVVSTVEEKNSADPIRIALGVEHKITTFKKPLIQEVISQDAIANSVNRELADRLKGKVWVYDGDGSGEDGAFENSVLVTGESITRIINLLKKFTDKTICCEQAMELLITPILESLMYLYSFGFNAVNQLKSLSQSVETIKKAQKDKNGAVGVVIERVEALLVDLRCILNGYFKAKDGYRGVSVIYIEFWSRSKVCGNRSKIPHETTVNTDREF